MQYTSEQQDIIDHPGGHARIIAVAGSGKTQTLTGYVIRRLQQGILPRRLLVLMYNKSAQVDFEQRLRGQLNGLTMPDVRTFHSLAYRICQTLVRQGDMPHFDKRLLTESEMEPIVWRLLRTLAEGDLAEDILARKKKWVEPALAYFERVKSALESPEVVFEQTGLPDQCRLFIEAFYRFEDWRSDAQKMSFSDLIYDPVQRFVHEPHLAAQFAGHLDEIIVDEFQDINPVQQKLLDTLQGSRAAVVAVGDPDQTIYEFRGSRPSLLTQAFAERCQPLRDYQLSHTFRFGDQLSLVANQVIAGNYRDDAPRVQCHSHPTAAATVVHWLVADDSAEQALQQIRILAQHRPLSDVAVINRLWSNSARLELLLLAEAIPYRTDNQQTVLERYELRVFRVLLQLARGDAMGWDLKTRRAAWQSLLGQPFLKVRKAVIDEMIQTLCHVTHHWGRALRNAVPESLSVYQSELLFERARLIDRAERGEGDSASLIMAWIRATDYYAALRDNAFSAAQVDDQIGTVKAFARFVSQRGWRLTEGAQRLAELMAQRQDDQAGLLITSIHKAKGREWPVVIIPELNARNYPYKPEGELMLNASLASERRLLYVALTRAREQLLLLVPVPGSDQPPSPLLPEAYVTGAANLLEQRVCGAPLHLPAQMHQSTVSAFAQDCGLGDIVWQAPVVAAQADSSVAGPTVRHPTFGVGEVLSQDAEQIQIRFLKDGKARDFKRDLVLPLLQWLS